MDKLTENRPDTCNEMGLDCGDCVRHAAVTVAIICTDLQPFAVRQTFFQLYPSAGCQPMGPAFERAYLEAIVPHKRVARAERAGAAAAA